MHAIWSGSISFGLVTIPVQLLPATKKKSISFHLLHEKDQGRIHYQKVCEQENKEVPDEEITKAFEYQEGKFVYITPDEISDADPKMTRSIDILDFVEADQIDPVYFVRPYYLKPQPGGEKAYTLFNKALFNAGKVAVGQCVIRTKQYLVTIRPKENGLILETMVYSDEIVSVAEIPELASPVNVTGKELALAESLIDQMSGRFEPEKYRDQFRDKIMEIVEKKIAGEAVVTPKAAPLGAPVTDLVGALKASLEGLDKTG